jgi:hypothetical protein
VDDVTTSIEANGVEAEATDMLTWRERVNQIWPGTVGKPKATASYATVRQHVESRTAKIADSARAARDRNCRRPPEPFKLPSDRVDVVRAVAGEVAVAYEENVPAVRTN